MVRIRLWRAADRSGEDAEVRYEAVDVGFVKSIYGRDPEGNLIEIQETAEDCAFDARNLEKAGYAWTRRTSIRAPSVAGRR